MSDLPKPIIAVGMKWLWTDSKYTYWEIAKQLYYQLKGVPGAIMWGARDKAVWPQTSQVFKIAIVRNIK